MGLDEVGTARRLREHRKVTDALVAKHGGRLVKTTGDGVLLEFPSVVDAVECAVAVQAVMAERNAGVPEDRRMLYRIGINLGDILIEGDDILGDGVNVAARLEGIAKPGGICISSSAYDQVSGKVAVEFNDLGEQRLKNIARPVRAYAVVPNGVVQGKTVSNETVPIAMEGPRSTLLDSTKPPLLPNKPSIAVLPFQNMSGDPEQEYFADGMVEDIITALSRFSSLFVIARNSSFAYKGKAIDIKKVGRELGVQYVLEGSVRRAGSLVRITGQLIEVAAGAHLWANKFDGSTENVFELQDSIATSVVGAIVPQLISASAELVRRKPVESWDSYDHYLRGIALSRQMTAEGDKQAQLEYKTAISLDPDFALALSQAAVSIHHRWAYLISITAEERTEAVRLAKRAIELAPDDATVLGRAAYVLGNLNDEIERGVALADRAIALNPNLAMAWTIKGYLTVLLGDMVSARQAIDHGIRLNPLDIPNMIGALRSYGAACSALGQYEERTVWAKKLLTLFPADVHAMGVLHDDAVRTGDTQVASTTLSRIQSLYPNLRKSHFREMYLRYRKPEHNALVLEMINRSHLPE
jgi:adenylate cyclase